MQEQIDRIEAKIDALMELLVAIVDSMGGGDDDDDEPAEFDLSGLVMSRPRVDGEPL